MQQVAWIRHSDLNLLTVGMGTYTTDARFSATSTLMAPDVDVDQPLNDWSLQIQSVRPSDEGVYECQVGTTPHINRFIHLTVVGDSLTFIKFIAKLSNYRRLISFVITIFLDEVLNGVVWQRCNCIFVSEPTTTILGGNEIHINVGSTINLTCLVKHSPDPPAHVFWTHNQQVSTFQIYYQFNQFVSDCHHTHSSCC